MSHKGKVHIHDLHFDHVTWENELSFYANELDIFQNRLDEVATRNSSDEVTKQISHYQNQIIIQKEQIDILRHDLKIYEQSLAKFAKEHPVAIDHYLFNDHVGLRKRMERFEQLYADFKKDFKKFVGIWL